MGFFELPLPPPAPPDSFDRLFAFSYTTASLSQKRIEKEGELMKLSNKKILPSAEWHSHNPSTFFYVTPTALEPFLDKNADHDDAISATDQNLKASRYRSPPTLLDDIKHLQQLRQDSEKHKTGLLQQNRAIHGTEVGQGKPNNNTANPNPTTTEPSRNWLLEETTANVLNKDKLNQSNQYSKLLQPRILYSLGTVTPRTLSSYTNEDSSDSKGIRTLITQCDSALAVIQCEMRSIKVLHSNHDADRYKMPTKKQISTTQNELWTKSPKATNLNKNYEDVTTTDEMPIFGLHYCNNNAELNKIVAKKQILSAQAEHSTIALDRIDIDNAHESIMSTEQIIQDIKQTEREIESAIYELDMGYVYCNQYGNSKNRSSQNKEAEAKQVQQQQIMNKELMQELQETARARIVQRILMTLITDKEIAPAVLTTKNDAIGNNKNKTEHDENPLSIVDSTSSLKARETMHTGDRSFRHTPFAISESIALTDPNAAPDNSLFSAAKSSIANQLPKEFIGQEVNRRIAAMIKLVKTTDCSELSVKTTASSYQELLAVHGLNKKQKERHITSNHLTLHQKADNFFFQNKHQELRSNEYSQSAVKTYKSMKQDELHDDSNSSETSQNITARKIQAFQRELRTDDQFNRTSTCTGSDQSCSLPIYPKSTRSSNSTNKKLLANSPTRIKKKKYYTIRPADIRKVLMPVGISSRPFGQLNPTLKAHEKINGISKPCKSPKTILDFYLCTDMMQDQEVHKEELWLRSKTTKFKGNKSSVIST